MTAAAIRSHASAFRPRSPARLAIGLLTPIAAGNAIRVPVPVAICSGFAQHAAARRELSESIGVISNQLSDRHVTTWP